MAGRRRAARDRRPLRLALRRAARRARTRGHRAGRGEVSAAELSGGHRQRDRGRHGAPRAGARGNLGHRRGASQRPSRRPSTRQFRRRCASSPTPSRTPRSSSRRSAPRLLERIEKELQLPSRRASTANSTRSRAATRSRPPTPSTSRSCARRSRSRSGGPTVARPTRSAPIATEVGDTPDARLGALHPRPDPGADARHAGHGQGRAAHRRPLAGHQEALHPPLQLPAVLGRGDGLHAGPEAP